VRTTWLPSWTDGPLRHAILDFVTASSDESSPRFIAPPDRVEGTDILSWINANTDPGDLVILPFVGVALRPVAEQIYNSGRSLLAIAHNPGSSSALAGSTMSLPTGATVNPT
jgi:hypothetical protein